MADPVWLLVMFDLPVLTKEQRRSATRYRKLLLHLGFNAAQLSVYSKYLINASSAIPVLSRVKSSVPLEGSVRVLKLTDGQWSSQDRFFGPEIMKEETKPGILEFFDTWESPDLQ
jgi:CRISPR-associated protein Cas2